MTAGLTYVFMQKDFNILITGIGGQGLITLLQLIAQAAFDMARCPDKFAAILSEISKLRKNRRHELPSFLREITLNIRFRNFSFGTLKDLIRHRRILWRSKPDMSGLNGWHIPKDIKAIGGEVLLHYQQAIRFAAESAEWLRRRGFEEQADYAEHITSHVQN